jgi:hypothetical protein
VSAPQDDDYRSRLDYGFLVDALKDADRVVADLDQIASGQLLIPAVDIDFTVRRARKLIRAVARELNTRGIE